MAASSLKMAALSDFIIQKEPTLQLVIRGIACPGLLYAPCIGDATVSISFDDREDESAEMI